MDLFASVGVSFPEDKSKSKPSVQKRETPFDIEKQLAAKALNYPKESDEFFSSYISDNTDLSDLQAQLSPVQWEAVSVLHGPCLLLSGAGSGKTRVLTYKMAALIRSGICKPNELFAVTFTNKAAGEMRERAGRLLGSALTLPWLGTFHSISAKFLRFHADRIGYKSSFTIYDRDDQKRALKNILKENSRIGGYEFTPESLRFMFSQWKNKGLTPSSALSIAKGEEENAYAQAYVLYQKQLRDNNAMDFDDLLLNVCVLLRTCDDLRERYQSHFKAILIDEFQDTNQVQFELVRLLLGEEQNITLVGDDDQSIYGWRGAEIANILNFQKSFPSGRVIEMGQNYRSTGNIIGVAASVIANNQSRLGKKIWTENPSGDIVELRSFDDENEEARWIANHVQGLEPDVRKKTAVFYRTNAQSRVVEDAFRRERIPYVLVGSTRFYDRREVKDLLAYLQVLSNPLDSVSLGRIINIPRRGIGDKTVETFVDMALQKGISLWQCMEDEVANQPELQAVRKITPFITLITQFKNGMGEKTVEELIEWILEATNYRTHLEEVSEGESIDRLSNVEELVSAAADFEERNPGKGLSDFLQEIALYTELDAKQNAEGAVSLMTIHSSKGLEFSRVYITGLEEGLFPLYRDGDVADLEEERRLFYVAVTRAEKNLFLSYALFRRLWNYGNATKISRFLEEVDMEFMVEYGKKSKAYTKDGRTYEPFDENDSPFKYGKQKSKSNQLGSHSEAVYLDGELIHTDSSEMIVQRNKNGEDQVVSTQVGAGQTSNYRLGQRVSHQQFGIGTVQQLDGHGDSKKIHILFAGYGRKTLMLKFAKLSPCD